MDEKMNHHERSSPMMQRMDRDKNEGLGSQGLMGDVSPTRHTYLGRQPVCSEENHCLDCSCIFYFLSFTALIFDYDRVDCESYVRILYRVSFCEGSWMCSSKMSFPFLGSRHQSEDASPQKSCTK